MKLLQITLFLSLSFLFINNSFAQKRGKKKEVEVVEVPAFTYIDNKITYQGTQAVEGSKSEIYTKAISSIKGNYKNPTDVLRIKDAENGKIECKARFRIWDVNPKTEAQTQAGLVQYQLFITCEDGKLTYKLSNIGHKLQTFFPAEKWDAENKKAYTYRYASYLNQMDQEVTKAIDGFLKKL